jgi:hypothetical protein
MTFWGLCFSNTNGYIQTAASLPDQPQAPGHFTLSPKYDCLMDVIDQWFGTGQFADEFGGIRG